MAEDALMEEMTYQCMLENTEQFNKGMTHGIDHAVAVIRAALTQGDVHMGSTLNHAGLQALHKDILELRRNAQQLLERGATLLVNRVGFTTELNPASPEVREFLMNPKPGQIINVPEHRLKDAVYESARQERELRACGRRPAFDVV